MIEIVVVEVRGDKVRLGIVAPTAVPVHRQEVYEAIQRERRAKEQAQREAEKNDDQTPPPAA